MAFADRSNFHQEIFSQNTYVIEIENVLFNNIPYLKADDFYIEYKNHLLFMCQCRLDNRQEIFDTLNLQVSDHQVLSDGELLHLLYLRYGKQCTNYVRGKYLVAAFNKNNERLTLLQDPFEYGVLYYYTDKDKIVFATQLSVLLACKSIPKKIIPEKVLSREAIFPSSNKHDTFFEGINILGPGHCLTLDKNGVQKERYWHPEKILINHKITQNEAVEELSFLFEEAVRHRIEKGNSVASMLSGGLDSGSVTSIAALLFAQKNKSLHTYSHIPLYDLDGMISPNNKHGNERPFMEAVIAKYSNIFPHFLTSEHIGMLQGIRQLQDILHEPIHAATNAFWIIDIAQQAKNDGHDVILSGEIGNGTISFTGYIPALGYSDLNWFYKFKKFVRPAYHYLKPNKQPQQTESYKHIWQAYSYLDINFANSINLPMLIEQSGRPVDFKALKFESHQKYMLEILMPGYNKRLRTGQELSEYFGIAYRDPTADVRIIEFMLSLPNSFFVSKSLEKKQMIKKMMKGRLPDKVLFQQGKGLQSADNVKRVQKDIDEIEAIINDFQTNLFEQEIYDKKRMLNDIALLREYKLNKTMTHHLLRSVGIMEFLNNYK